MTQQADTELLPCPFCGGRAEINQHDDECYFTKLAAASGKQASDMNPMLELIPAWNRRAPAAQAQRANESEPEVVLLPFVTPRLVEQHLGAINEAAKELQLSFLLVSHDAVELCNPDLAAGFAADADARAAFALRCSGFRPLLRFRERVAEIAGSAVPRMMSARSLPLEILRAHYPLQASEDLLCPPTDGRHGNA